jgi:putative ABC transport system ATP-binding protein
MPAESLAAECRDLLQVYPAAGGAVAALRGVDAEFGAGTVTVVIGPSGAGKSTFLRLLACLERPAAGEVLIDGQATAELQGKFRRRMTARHIGYVFQRPSDNLLDYLTVGEHVDLAARMREGGAASENILVTSGLADRRERRPRDLSVGEHQRLAFVMAVAGQPALVIADEPTAELDPTATAALVALIPTLARAGQTFVIASHDPAVIHIADQVLVIQNGVLTAQGTGADAAFTIVDGAGRVQLPAAATARFPDRRVRVVVDDSGVRLEEP